MIIDTIDKIQQIEPPQITSIVVEQAWSNTRLIGSINTVAEIVVDTISTEGIRSVFAFDHLRSKILLICLPN